MWTGIQLCILEYKDYIKRYYCGKKLLDITKPEPFTHIICLIDTKECTIARVNKSKVDIIFHDTSFIPGKHNQGGQSAARFARAREELIKSWLKDIAAVLKTVENLPIILGGPGKTKEGILNHLPREYVLRIERVVGCEYTCYGGVLQVKKKHIQ